MNDGTALALREPAGAGSPMAAAEIAAFTCGAVAISVCLGLCVRHACHLRWVALQVQMIRIVFLIPATCVTAILTLIWPHQEDYFGLILAFWEAFTFAAFLQLMLLFCGGRQAVVSYLGSTEGGLRRPIFCCFLCAGCPGHTYRNGAAALAGYERRVAAFCFLKPTCEVARIIVHRFRGRTVGANVLQAIAICATIHGLTALMVLEGRVLHKALAGLRIKLKFWAIKGVIIAIVIQSFVIMLLADNAQPRDPTDLAQAYEAAFKVDALHRSLQILILYEMLGIATPMFIWAFSLRLNLAVLHHGPVEPPKGCQPCRCLAVALLLAPVDYVRFVIRALFVCRTHAAEGPRHEPPRCEPTIESPLGPPPPPSPPDIQPKAAPEADADSSMADTLGPRACPQTHEEEEPRGCEEAPLDAVLVALAEPSTLGPHR